MHDLIEQINKAMDSNLYYLALYTALTLPDICAALESNNGKATGDKYKDWFNRYISPKYKGNLTGEECYCIRCSLLHQGITQHNRSNYSRILFIEPSVNNNMGLMVHNNILEDALNIDIKTFCNDIINAVNTWLNDVKGKEPFETNYKRIIKRYPEGLSPYIVGIPIIT